MAKGVKTPIPGGYRFAVHAIGARATLPPLRNSNWLTIVIKNFPDIPVKQGAHSVSSLTTSLCRHSRLVIDIYIYEDTSPGTEKNEIREDCLENASVTGELLLLHNLTFPKLAFKALVINAPDNDKIIISCAEAVPSAIPSVNNPFTVSLPLCMKFPVSGGLMKPLVFVRNVRRLLRQTSTRNLLIRNNLNNIQAAELTQALIENRWIQKNCTVTFSPSVYNGESGVISVSTRPSPFFILIRDYYFHLYQRVIRDPFRDDDFSRNLEKFNIFAMNPPWRLVLTLSKRRTVFSRVGNKKQTKHLDQLMLEPDSERFVNPSYSDDYPFDELI
jgi:hypothetical protein